MDQSNKPVLLIGDSPHSMLANLSLADMGTYFADRQKYGFSIFWVELLCNSYTHGKANGASFLGDIPFSPAGRLDKPNEPYWAYVDSMVKLAAQHGQQILMDTVDTAGWDSVLQNATEAQALAYGQFLGNRYKNTPNIIWITGNDFQDWKTNQTVATNVGAIMRGIAQTDPNHIQSTELQYYVSASRDATTLQPELVQPLLNNKGLDGVYTYYPPYAKLLQEYNRTPVMPTWRIEGVYANECGMDCGNPVTLRTLEYEAMLSGAAGQLYGDHTTWTFPSNWKTAMDNEQASEVKIMTHFFNGLAWTGLVPDRSHALVTGGYGTFASTGSVHSNNYVTAAKTADGKLAVAYAPKTTTLTVDMSKMSGLVQASWFDPTSGATTLIQNNIPNTGKKTFTTHKNAKGDPDLLLVLKAG